MSQCETNYIFNTLYLFQNLILESTNKVVTITYAIVRYIVIDFVRFVNKNSF